MEICPICFKEFPIKQLENHVNKCLFLSSTNSDTDQRKRRSTSTCHSTVSSVKRAKQQPLENCHTFITPLPIEMQPTSLDNFFGHNNVLGKESELRLLLEKADIPSMILWGPPGCGKTSLANIIQNICKENSTRLRYIGMKYTILANVYKTLQVYVAKRNITILGATTENPSFCINTALLAMVRVVVMEKLKSSHLVAIIENATRHLGVNVVLNTFFQPQNYKGQQVITKSDIAWLADTSDGDARIALNNLQMMLQHNGRGSIKWEIKKSHMMYDRRGEEHHNTIAAMHESIRGSNDNAAVYWMARMITSGEDPSFIARRMVRAASEEMGNADPGSLQLAVSAMQGCQLIGKDDSDVLLAQCAIYLARAPTLKRDYFKLEKAKQAIASCRGPQPSVPIHLRDVPTKLLVELGYDNKKTFMPEGMEHVKFF
ncbi:hypothetical protein RI129_004226 [Pyrocoelia pectoralis]|uniref:UBZ4-type domain-containing protein n=1 Tax=Pyrocoelia pectoralis TaxID=417401 RepID=A0AAN7VDJ5_9COLE